MGIDFIIVAILIGVAVSFLVASRDIRLREFADGEEAFRCNEPLCVNWPKAMRRGWIAASNAHGRRTSAFPARRA